LHLLPLFKFFLCDLAGAKRPYLTDPILFQPRSPLRVARARPRGVRRSTLASAESEYTPNAHHVRDGARQRGEARVQLVAGGEGGTDEWGVGSGRVWCRHDNDRSGSGSGGGCRSLTPHDDRDDATVMPTPSRLHVIIASYRRRRRRPGRRPILGNRRPRSPDRFPLEARKWPGLWRLRQRRGAAGRVALTPWGGLRGCMHRTVWHQLQCVTMRPTRAY
jgi:hypothetical protein